LIADECVKLCRALPRPPGAYLDSCRAVCFGANCGRSAPFTEDPEAFPTRELCGVTKMPSDEWIRTFADGRNVKFSHDEMIDGTFITAQIEGNEVVYSILLSMAEAKLSREEVERRFRHELSKK
jgi:hypothetical protein